MWCKLWLERTKWSSWPQVRLCDIGDTPLEQEIDILCPKSVVQWRILGLIVNARNRFNYSFLLASLQFFE